MSEESEVTEYEQERMQHPTGHCEDCGCPLEVCCKPKEPVVEVEWLKFQITCIKHDYSNIETGFNELLKDIENQVVKKNE